MKKKNVYELALIKVQQEQMTLELMLREKNQRKKQLEEILQREEEMIKETKKRLEEEKTISPSIILLNRNIDYTKKQEIFSRIKRIENEILALKKEYLRIKRRKEKIVEQKENKEKEWKELKTKREYKLIQNDFVSKLFLEKEGKTFED